MSEQRIHQDTETMEFLTFTLADENYGLEIMKVKEIRGYEPVTKIANAPDYVKGVLNLRGDIVPILDLRLKFNVGTATYNEFTIVIMLSVANRIVGIVVDAVSDVINLERSQIKPPPEFGVAFDHKYLFGLASVQDHMVILLNIEALITSKELGLLAQKKQYPLDHNTGRMTFAEFWPESFYRDGLFDTPTTNLQG